MEKSFDYNILIKEIPKWTNLLICQKCECPFRTNINKIKVICNYDSNKNSRIVECPICQNIINLSDFGDDYMIFNRNKIYQKSQLDKFYSQEGWSCLFVCQQCQISFRLKLNTIKIKNVNCPKCQNTIYIQNNKLKSNL